MTRRFAAGALVFAVATVTAADRELVESLLEDLPQPSSTEREPVVFTLRRPDADAGAWEVDSPQLKGSRTATLGDALGLLLAEVNLGALDREPEHLHLHAAAATKEGRAVVIAAERNTGKTTTVAHLVERGWGYLTDETVRLSTATDDITGFPKPLSIKPWGRDLVDFLQPGMVPSTSDAAEYFRFVPIGASGGKVVDRGRPHLVILLRRRADQDPSAGPISRLLHPVDAVVALMQETLDAERFGSAALRLARLAATSRCVELTVGTPPETAQEIERLMHLDPVDDDMVSVLPPSDAFTAGVVTITIDDRCVVHDTASGTIFALDAGAARVWRQLGGWPVDDAVDVDSPVIRPFVAELRTLGVLAGVS